MPNVGDFADPRETAEIAHEAESAGWDGVFIWDVINQPFAEGDDVPIADSWITLAAIAMRTERIRIGTMITPLARRRPSKVARETVTLDRLSQGRVILGVGLGSTAGGEEREFAWFGEESDASVRAAKLDESLDVIAGLWGGEPFSYEGRFHVVHESAFVPVAVQRPRIPIWVGGYWPNKRPMRRAARFDGVIPCPENWGDGGFFAPDDVREILAYIAEHRTSEGPYDFVFFTSYPDSRPEPTAQVLAEYKDAGVTWWLQSVTTLDEALMAARAGPPRT
jgi:alkanesulfonate monooxygenase SsuD/methylene tetrahydromethanopterin reductase-like flavin-dependent oxidoreductase (luciferase family)